jgi:hypothetical protein
MAVVLLAQGVFTWFGDCCLAKRCCCLLENGCWHVMANLSFDCGVKLQPDANFFPYL